MGLDQLTHDVQPEPESVAARPLARDHRMQVEQVRQHLGGNAALVAHPDLHLAVACAVELDLHAAAVAVLERIAEQVRQHLCEARAVPAAVEAAARRQLDHAPRARRAVFLDHAQRDFAELGGRTLQRYAALTAQPREVEQVLDHAGHPPAAREDAPCRLLDGRLGAGALDDLRRHHHRVQRIAQVVSQHRVEGLLQLQRGRALLELPRQLDFLAVQLEEHLGLVAQDVRLERLVQEIDGSRFVALERAVEVVGACRDQDQRDVPRALVAAHQLGQLEAVDVGHLHVEQRQRHVVPQQQLERVAGRAGRQHGHVRPCQQRLQRVAVLLEIVDDEAGDRNQAAAGDAGRAVG